MYSTPNHLSCLHVQLCLMFMGALFRIRCIQVAKTRRCHHSVSELRVHGGFAGMESAQSEDNLEGKVGGSIPSPSPALKVMANSSRAYSSDDLRSMGAPTSGPSGMPGNSLLTHQTHCSSDPTPWVGLNSDACPTRVNCNPAVCAICFIFKTSFL